MYEPEDITKYDQALAIVETMQYAPENIKQALRDKLNQGKRQAISLNALNNCKCMKEPFLGLDI